MSADRLYTVDRIVGDRAVLEDDEGDSQNVSLLELPEGVGEGSVLRLTGTGYVVDAETEQTRRERIMALQKRLQNKTNA